MTTFELITEICKRNDNCTECIFDDNGCLFSLTPSQWKSGEIEKRLKVIHYRVKPIVISGDELMKRLKKLNGDTLFFSPIVEQIFNDSETLPKRIEKGLKNVKQRRFVIADTTTGYTVKDLLTGENIGEFSHEWRAERKQKELEAIAHKENQPTLVIQIDGNHYIPVKE